MTAVMFGETDWPLFGRFHRPAPGHRASIAAILCPPFGEEGIRSFRTFKVLADRLAASGIGTFRFDWYGSGDSSGDCGEITLDRWIDSLHLAHEEVQDMSGKQKIVWIGLRLGANAALHAAENAPRGLSGVVAWNPLDGVAAYQSDLLAAHETLVAASVGEPATREPKPQDEALGFVLPTAFFDAMKSASISVPKPPVRTVWIGPNAPGGVDAIDDLDGANWNSDQAMNAQLIPAAALSLIEERLKSW